MEEPRRLKAAKGTEIGEAVSITQVVGEGEKREEEEGHKPKNLVTRTLEATKVENQSHLLWGKGSRSSRGYSL